MEYEYRSRPAALRFFPVIAATLILAGLPAFAQARASVVGTYRSELHAFRLVKVLDGLDYPWSLAFLPDGRLLVTERRGRLLRIRDGRAEPVSGVPAVSSAGQGGLLDIALSPGFVSDRTVFFTYSQPGPGGAGTALARAVLDGTELREVRTIWSMERKTGAGQHFGSRLRFLPDGTLLFTTGERGQGDRAQDLGDDAGKTHRIAADGSIPRDNPFLADQGCPAVDIFLRAPERPGPGDPPAHGGALADGARSPGRGRGEHSPARQ